MRKLIGERMKKEMVIEPCHIPYYWYKGAEAESAKRRMAAERLKTYEADFGPIAGGNGERACRRAAQ